MNLPFCNNLFCCSYLKHIDLEGVSHVLEVESSNLEGLNYVLEAKYFNLKHINAMNVM